MPGKTYITLLFRLWICSLLLEGGISVLFASPQEFVMPDSLIRQEVEQFSDTSQKENAQIALRMEYAKPHILNADLASQIRPEWVDEVLLVFTMYPERPEAWRTDYDWLLENRFKALYEVAPALFDQSQIKWTYILQTGCKNESQAKSYFHGFVIRSSPKASSKIAEIIALDSTIKPLANIIFGEVPKLSDSSAYLVFERHPEWKDMLVVMDWTASMYENRASVLNWHRKHLDQKAIKYLILFNDGNRTPHVNKKIGKTGGIYRIDPYDFEAVLDGMLKVKQSGLGGDPAENDMEALLKSTRFLKDYGEIVLLPDRNSSMRDFKLMPYLDKPVRIVLFSLGKTKQVGLGAKKGVWIENTWIHPHYLTLASMTKGSIHTKDKDITHLHELKPGERFRFGSFIYEKKENGTFDVVR